MPHKLQSNNMGRAKRGRLAKKTLKNKTTRTDSPPAKFPATDGSLPAPTTPPTLRVLQRPSTSSDVSMRNLPPRRCTRMNIPQRTQIIRVNHYPNTESSSENSEDDVMRPAGSPGPPLLFPEGRVELPASSAKTRNTFDPESVNVGQFGRVDMQVLNMREEPPQSLLGNTATTIQNPVDNLVAGNALPTNTQPSMFNCPPDCPLCLANNLNVDYSSIPGLVNVLVPVPVTVYSAAAGNNENQPPQNNNAAVQEELRETNVPSRPNQVQEGDTGQRQEHGTHNNDQTTDSALRPNDVAFGRAFHNYLPLFSNLGRTGELLNQIPEVVEDGIPLLRSLLAVVSNAHINLWLPPDMGGMRGSARSARRGGSTASTPGPHCSSHDE